MRKDQPDKSIDKSSIPLVVRILQINLRIASPFSCMQGYYSLLNGITDLLYIQFRLMLMAYTGCPRII